MKFNTQLKALAAATALGLSGHAMAAGTAAETLITNTVVLDYTVDSIGQETILSSSEFMVDNRVDMTLTDDTGTSTIIPGGVITYTYTLTNTGNETQFFKLDLSNQIAANTDTGDLTIPAVTYTGGTVSGAGAASITGDVATIEPDTSIQYTASFTFPKKTSTNENIIDGDTFNILATATASTDATGVTPLTADVDTNKNLAENIADIALIVFAENASVDSILYNGIISTGTTTTAESAKFTKPGDNTKDFVFSATIINDPLCDPSLTSTSDSDYSSGTCPNPDADFDDTYKPKAIPGAMVKYTLQAENSGSQDATAVSFEFDLSTVTDDDPDVTFALVQDTLNNDDAQFSDGLITLTETLEDSSAATVTTNANKYTVTVPTFASGEDIEITFTAIVE